MLYQHRPAFSINPDSNDFTGPEGFEEVRNIIKVHVTAAAADPVPGNEYLFSLRMFLGEFRHSFLVIMVYMVGGLDFNGHPGIPDNGVNLKVFISMPVGKLLFASGIAKISTDFLYNQMLESMAVLRRPWGKVVSFGQMVGNANIKIVESGRLV